MLIAAFLCVVTSNTLKIVNDLTFACYPFEIAIKHCYVGATPAGIDPEAYSWFQSVDVDRSGYITLKELKQALVNSNWSTFNDDTCYMLLSKLEPYFLLVTCTYSTMNQCHTELYIT